MPIFLSQEIVIVADHLSYTKIDFSASIVARSSSRATLSNTRVRPLILPLNALRLIALVIHSDLWREKHSFFMLTRRYSAIKT